MSSMIDRAGSLHSPQMYHHGFLTPPSSHWGKRAADDDATDAARLTAGQRVLVSCLFGAAFWNTVVVATMITLTFKSRTLYFWAMVVSDVGVLLCAAQQAASFVATVDPLHIVYLSLAGWPLMVTGQSLVLYSRLHLLCLSKGVLRAVLAMIVTNGLAIHGAGCVLTIAMRLSSKYLTPYSIFERVNVSTFFVQEIILSGLYLWKSRGFLGQYSKQARPADCRTIRSTSLPIIRSILTQVVVVNIIILVLDLGTLVFEYTGLHLIQLGYKVFAYSVKLQFELVILNRLQEFANRTRRLNSLNSGVSLTPTLQREWDTTLERAFGTSHERASSEALPAEPGSAPLPSKRRSAEIVTNTFEGGKA